MKLTTIKTQMFGLGSTVLVLGLIASGLALAPNNASAFWPWGNFHSLAQAYHNNDDSVVTVTIQEYIDGELATGETANNTSFPMTASWDDSGGIGSGSGSYDLSIDNSYTAETAQMQVGADYSTSQLLDGDVVSMSCDEGHPYKFIGYSTGSSVAAAASADIMSTAPAFVNLEGDHYVIVWSESCDDDIPQAGDISGEVTGGQSNENPGVLEVTSVDAQKTTATANGEFADGWQYVFDITVPTDEPNLAMKFEDWAQTDGANTIPVADNIRISSEQASATSTVVLTADGVYSSPDLHVVNDLDANEDGLQVQVLVEVAIPADTYNGTYSTSYGVRTLP